MYHRPLFLVLFLLGLASPSLCAQVTGGPALNDSVDPMPAATAEAWLAQDDVQQVATSLDSTFTNLGNNWYFSSSNETYYYLGFYPYIYDFNATAWFYSFVDEDGIYYYDFATMGWNFFNRLSTFAEPVE